MEQSDINFLNSVAFANSGSVILYFTEQEIDDILLILNIFNHVTLNDVMTYVHINRFTHDKYLDLLRTVLNNAPLDLNTYIIQGEKVNRDISIYPDTSVDVVLWYHNKGPSIFEYIHLLWTKLKCNGVIVIKGVKENDESSKLQLKFIFGNVITIPQGILVEIVYVNESDIVTIRKPCY